MGHRTENVDHKKESHLDFYKRWDALERPYLRFVKPPFGLSLAMVLKKNERNK